MAQLSFTGQQLDQAIRKVREESDIYTVLAATKYGSGSASLFSVTVTATNLTPDQNNPVTIMEDSSITLNFTANPATYKTPTTAPSVTNATGLYIRTSSTRCSVVISNPYGNVSMSISGTAIVTRNFTISDSGGTTHSMTCESGMTWAEYAASEMPGATNIVINGTDVMYQNQKIFTTSSYATACSPSDTILAQTYYSADASLILTGTWLLNMELVDPESDLTTNVTFTSNGVTYTNFTIRAYDSVLYGSTKVYLWEPDEEWRIGWLNEANRTITFAGTGAVSIAVRNWIYANGIQL